jgi:hypothetical protein
LPRDDRHPDVDGGPVAGTGKSGQRSELVACGSEADLEALDPAEPAVGTGFVDAVAEVADDFFESAALHGVDSQYWASNGACS